MRVLFIGNYYDGTGYAAACIDHILALDTAGVDVVPRPIKLNNRRGEVPKRILELEQKTSSGCDVCIQFTLPHLMDYNGRFKKNIAMFAWETDDFSTSSWPQKLRCMDEIWVSCPDMVHACRRNALEHIRIVSYPCDITKYQKEYKPIDIPERGQDFIFYFIGEMNRRKNLAALIKAFHLEFNPTEPVSLLIKTGIPGLSPDIARQRLVEFCNEIKKGMKLYPTLDCYRPEILITEELSNHDIMRLHSSCDCFVMPSRGESWCIPAFDAMAMGKTPITTDSTGMSCYNDDSTGTLVLSHEEPVFGMVDTFNDIYTSREYWREISIMDLRHAMRDAYEDKEGREEKSACGINRAYYYDYMTVGTIMKDFLYE